MTAPSTSPSDEFTVPRHQFGEEWHVDDEGTLHTGESTPFADRIVVTCGDRKEGV